MAQNRIAAKCAQLQALLQQLSADSAASSATLMQGSDECARLQEHTTLLSKQLSRAAMQVVDHQRDVLGALQTKLEAQHLTLVAVGEQRDAAKVEAATLLRRIEESTAKMALSDGERASLVAAQEALQGQVSALQLELQQARQQHDAAAARAREAGDVQHQLTEELTAARQSHAAAEEELEGGESAVAQLLQQQQQVAEALAGERSALLAKNAALTAQMQATQVALQQLQESAAEALHAASRENDELAARNAQLANEMEALSGKDGAALAPALAEARSQLAAMQERCAQLAAANAQLEQHLQGGRGGPAPGEHTVLQARLAAINESFDSIGLHGNGHAGREPSESGLTDDTASEAGFSDMASVMSEAPGMTDAQRAANRMRSAQNKAKFDAIKAERNAFKQEAKKAAKELERMRMEVAKVEELKNQLKALQDNMYV